MATIKDIRISITNMTPPVFEKMLHAIRARRRTKPTKAIRAKKKAPAKTKRAPRKRMQPQDMFAIVKGMSDEDKLKLAAKLIGGK